MDEVLGELGELVKHMAALEKKMDEKFDALSKKVDELRESASRRRSGRWMPQQLHPHELTRRRQRAADFDEALQSLAARLDSASRAGDEETVRELQAELEKLQRDDGNGAPTWPRRRAGRGSSGTRSLVAGETDLDPALARRLAGNGPIDRVDICSFAVFLVESPLARRRLVVGIDPGRHRPITVAVANLSAVVAFLLEPCLVGERKLDQEKWELHRQPTTGEKHYYEHLRREAALKAAADASRAAEVALQLAAEARGAAEQQQKLLEDEGEEEIAPETPAPAETDEPTTGEEVEAARHDRRRRRPRGGSHRCRNVLHHEYATEEEDGQNTGVEPTHNDYGHIFYGRTGNPGSADTTTFFYSVTNGEVRDAARSHVADDLRRATVRELARQLAVRGEHDYILTAFAVGRAAAGARYAGSGVAMQSVARALVPPGAFAAMLSACASPLAAFERLGSKQRRKRFLHQQVERLALTTRATVAEPVPVFFRGGTFSRASSARGASPTAFDRRFRALLFTDDRFEVLWTSEFLTYVVLHRRVLAPRRRLPVRPPLHIRRAVPAL